MLPRSFSDYVAGGFLNNIDVRSPFQVAVASLMPRQYWGEETTPDFLRFLRKAVRSLRFEQITGSDTLFFLIGLVFGCSGFDILDRVESVIAIFNEEMSRKGWGKDYSSWFGVFEHANFQALLDLARNFWESLNGRSYDLDFLDDDSIDYFSGGEYTSESIEMQYPIQVARLFIRDLIQNFGFFRNNLEVAYWSMGQASLEDYVRYYNALEPYVSTSILAEGNYVELRLEGTLIQPRQIITEENTDLSREFNQDVIEQLPNLAEVPEEAGIPEEAENYNMADRQEPAEVQMGQGNAAEQVVDIQPRNPLPLRPTGGAPPNRGVREHLANRAQRAEAFLNQPYYSAFPTRQFIPNNGMPNFTQMAETFYNRVKTQLDSVRPYPYYKYSVDDTVKGLAELATIINAYSGQNVEIANFEANPWERCSPVEFLNWVDVFRMLYPNDVAKLSIDMNQENPTAAASHWKNISTTYKNLVVAPSEIVNKHLDVTKTQPLLEDYLKKTWENLPRNLSAAEKQTQLAIAMDIIANNPRYLGYLRSKAVSKLNGTWSITAAHVQQSQLEDVYAKIQDVGDFVNEPKVLEMKKTISDLYAVKKRVSTGKRVSETLMVIPNEESDLQFKGQTIKVKGYHSLPLDDFHSLYVTFPQFSYVQNRTPGQQVAIYFQLVSVIPTDRGEVVKVQDLYRIAKISESSGVSLRPKAYIYWVRQFVEGLFHKFTGFTVGSPDMSKPYTKAQLTRYDLQISFQGYTPGTTISFKKYDFEPASFVDYPFLKGERLIQKFVYLLDMISKQNYKMEKYRQKVAKRQKYALANQNGKMLNAVYARFGEPNSYRR